MTLFHKENPLAVTLTVYEVLASALADLGSKIQNRGPASEYNSNVLC